MSLTRSAVIRNYQRGLAPWLAKNLQEKLAVNVVPPTRINIGLPHKQSRSNRMEGQMEEVKKRRSDSELEKLARNQKLLIDLDQANKDWLATKGPEHIKKIADHYGVYETLFEEGYFLPVVHLDINYQIDEESTMPVYYGNVIKPTEACKAPDVSFEANEDTYWTLMLTNMDGNMENSDKEYLHWCITNIPGNAIEKGETVIEYLQPIPLKGTGFHRYAFILYKHDEKIPFNFKKLTRTSPFSERTFHTRDWYSKYQDKVTPAGLAFFQSDWDVNITQVFHDMDMKEPVFEYDFPKPYIKPQTWFPLKEPFNLYMDKYRDPKQIAKEYILKKLKIENPFKKPDPPLKYPNVHRLPKSMPSWLELQTRKDRLGWGRVNDF